MPRKVLSVLLCVLLLVQFTACGGAKPEAAEPAATSETAEATPAGDYTYAEAYMQYLAVCSALRSTVESRVETHNAILKSRSPDSYYMDPAYLMLVYTPFTTAYPALGSALGRDNLEGAQNALRETFPDAVLSSLDENSWQAIYTYLDKTSGQEVPRQGKCLWECDHALGSFRVRAYLDGELVEFTEFVPQGNDLYLLYTMTDKALVRCTAGEVPAFWHAHRISEPAMDAFPGDMRLCSLEEKDFFPAEAAIVSWITGDNNAQYVLTLENNAMTYTGRIAQDVLDRDGVRIGVQWMDIDPITLLS